jgi:xylulose-5-phosphate/fructose-6-phosphate phosphoketolase
LEALFVGYGYKPHFVAGDDPSTMHQEMASILEQCILEIRSIQNHARSTADATRPRWPMIVLRSPKGWTGPKEVDGHNVENSWRAHQVPVLDPVTNKKSLRIVEEWMRSYKPDELFDARGALVSELQELAPSGARRISANPHANGGLLRKALDLPDFRKYATHVKNPGLTYVSPTDVLAHFLAEVMRRNMTSFRVFGPDETASNKLTAIYAASKKTWVAEFKPEDADGGELDVSGRVMEMLSEHTLEGWFEGYVLTGRHGLFSTYEAFVHVIDSMFNQHAKWLEKAKKELAWRAPVPSINILITSLVWRQDHNGFTHQDPGFLDVVTNKSPDVVRIYLPPDANTLLSVADHCLRSQDYVNVIVADKQEHLQYLSIEEAVTHCTKGIGIWDWASTDDCKDPDVVMACAGDIATMESLAAVAILKKHFPDLKIRFVNIVDLFRLMPETEHPHGLSDRDFDSLFTTDKPVIFNFHSYASLIHKLSYRRKNHHNIHVRGYKEKGNINTPLELAIINQVDRFSLTIDVVDRVPRLRSIGAHVKEEMKDQIIDSIAYAHAEGIDRQEIRSWLWPG